MVTPSGPLSKHGVADSLKHRMELFKRSARVFSQDDVFAENSRVQVMMGQGLTPQGYHNIAQAMSSEQMTVFLKGIQHEVARLSQSCRSMAH